MDISFGDYFPLCPHSQIRVCRELGVQYAFQRALKHQHSPGNFHIGIPIEPTGNPFQIYDASQNAQTYARALDTLDVYIEGFDEDSRFFLVSQKGSSVLSLRGLLRASRAPKLSTISPKAASSRYSRSSLQQFSTGFLAAVHSCFR